VFFLRFQTDTEHIGAVAPLPFSLRCSLVACAFLRFVRGNLPKAAPSAIILPQNRTLAALIAFGAKGAEVLSAGQGFQFQHI
jgi:hypothetical protein